MCNLWFAIFAIAYDANAVRPLRNANARLAMEVPSPLGGSGKTRRYRHQRGWRVTTARLRQHLHGRGLQSEKLTSPQFSARPLSAVASQQLTAPCDAANLASDIAGAVAAITEDDPDVESERISRQHPWLTGTAVRGGQAVWMFSLM